jgi:hypothetical protein
MMTDLTPTDPGNVLDLFGSAEEIEISTRRMDGTLRGYRHATEHPFGAIRFGSHQVEVAFAPA